jgi:glyoxylate/hydroxypyruvate reductase A
MSKPVAVVMRLDTAEAGEWRDQIAALLPDERIPSFRDMSAQERQVAEIAIFTNPDLAEVAALPGLVWIHSLWAGVARLVSELARTRRRLCGLSIPNCRASWPRPSWPGPYYLQRDMPR